MSLLIALLLAQTQAAPARPCIEDAHKFCPGLRPGDGGQLKACLESHRDEVTADCRAKMHEVSEDGQFCKNDVEKLCPKTHPGPERASCMKAHESEVSPECKKFYREMQERRQESLTNHPPGGGGPMKEARSACQSDMEKFCQGVQPGDGRIIACLQQHQADLSPACSSQMKH
jgi:Cysteine rich repeat